MTTIADILDKQDPTRPCNGCQHFNRCRDECLACGVFYSYVEGKGKTDCYKWGRAPSAEWYAAVFCTVESEADAGRSTEQDRLIGIAKMSQDMDGRAICDPVFGTNAYPNQAADTSTVYYDEFE